MANASVEKLKALGLRHGEKAVMALTTMLCLLFLFKGATRETIDLTPEQVKQAAESARSNIERNQSEDDILARIESEGVKNPGFVAIVEQQEKNLLVADNYRPHQLWVSPEPGAGLIREQPELIAPTELYAYPGRGAALVFALDDNGNRFPDPDAGKKPEDADTTARRKRKSHTAVSSRSARSRMNKAQKEEEAKKKAEFEKKRLQAAVVGAAPKEAPADPAAAAAAAGPMKEITKGVRWVSIIGVLNNKLLRENYLNALKRPEVAYPHFKQLDVERQVKQPDDSWSDWQPIDLERNRTILDQLPEEDEEWTPETVRISSLVAPLPFLKSGFWEKVHVARMVPAEKFKVAEAPVATGDEFGAMAGGDVMVEPEPMVEEPVAMDEGTGGMPEDMMGGGMGYGGPEESINFEKTDADEIMIRSLDFTADPDRTYRFRLRIVVYNPNRGREDISPGTDTKSIELFGPWSEPTEEVTMPPDVATYAINKEQPVNRKLEQINYEVARWSPEDGVTVVKRFTAAPGEIIGEPRTADIPASDGSGKKPKRVDFNSHQIVLDAMGGNQPIPQIGAGSGQLSIPALSLVTHPDGSVVIRSQANDLHDPVRKDMAENYARELKESDKKRQNSQGFETGDVVEGAGP